MTTAVVWLLLGLCIGFGSWWCHTRWFRRRADSDLAAHQPASGESAEPDAVDCDQVFAQEFVRHVFQDVHEPLTLLAGGIGRELADLATAVQGNAQLLCEVTGEPELIPARCEHLWSGVKRLRLLSEKILTFASDVEIEQESIDVRAFLDDVRREIETVHGNLLSVQVATTAFLPHAQAHPRSLLNALLFVVETLLEIEPRTRTLSIAAYADVSEDDVTTIGIEICAETEVSYPPVALPRAALQIGYLAARRSLEAQGAQLSIQQIAGVSATSFITLEADTSEHRPGAEPRGPRPSEHEFGGVLVLERDSSIRSMIANEVERCGRKILVSVDGAAARALLEATPERFELLILEVDAPHESGIPIARDALERNPDIKVLLLGRNPEHPRVKTPSGSVVVALRKPFGILELRAELRALLEVGDPDDAHSSID